MDKSRYITVHTVRNTPGNPVKLSRIRTDTIEVFGVAADDMIQIGAATIIHCAGGVFFTTESMEEVSELITAAEKAAV